MWWWIRATRRAARGHGARPGGVSVQPGAERRVAARLTALGERVKRVAADGAEVALGQRAAGAGCGFLHLHPSRFDAAEVHRRGSPARIRGLLDLCLAAQSPLRGKPALRQGDRRALVAAGEKPSLYHAEPIAGENRPLLDRRLGVHRFDGLAVLKTATMPAVLVEAGVIVNPDDEARVARPDTIERMARAIADGVHACLGG